MDDLVNYMDSNRIEKQQDTSEYLVKERSIGDQMAIQRQNIEEKQASVYPRKKNILNNFLLLFVVRLMPFFTLYFISCTLVNK